MFPTLRDHISMKTNDRFIPSWMKLYMLTVAKREFFTAKL